MAIGDEDERADSLHWYLTGAGNDGGAQGDPEASFGNYRASTRYGSLGMVVSGGPGNITAGFAPGSNGTGVGSVDAPSADTLTWAPPGGSAGAAVTIANGQTKVLEGGAGEVEKYVIVSRTSADNLSGTATVTLADSFNLLFDNVSSAERGAGDTEYRGLCMKNENASEIKELKIWLALNGTAAGVDAGGYAGAGAVTVTAKVAGGFSDWPDAYGVYNKTTGEVLYYESRTDDALTVPAAGRDVWGDGLAAGNEDDVIVPIALLRLAKEAPSAQPAGFAQTIANEGASPAAVSFVHPAAKADGDVINLGDLAAGNIQFLWFERIVIAGATADADVLDLVDVEFESL